VNDDRAIVVGISSYPDLGSLKSPENDAQDFYRWLTDDEKSGGGGLTNPGQARLILSSHYPNSHSNGNGLAPPTRDMIEAELISLDIEATAKDDAGEGLRLGRRLYLYFSGHGCAPTFDEAAILMANATRKRIYHLTGMPVADWFFRAKYFDEIVLLMDCCREPYEKAVMYVPPWVQMTNPSAIVSSQRFYGLAAPWSRLCDRGCADVPGDVSTAVAVGRFRAKCVEVSKRNSRSCEDPTYRQTCHSDWFEKRLLFCASEKR
jgi:hypothetical protein